MLVDELDEDAAGAERFVAGLATALPRDRYDVSVCVTRRVGGPFPAALADAGVGCFCLERGSGLDVLAFRPLARYLRRHGVDVLHAHKFGSNVWGTLLGRLCGVPVVVAHEHTWSYEGQSLRRLLDRHLIGRFATIFVAVSTTDRDQMLDVEKVPPQKVVVIPNAYVPRVGSSTGDIRAELGIPGSAPVIGTAAFLRPQKALHVLVDAFALLASSIPEARLVIAGEGPCGKELESRAAERGVEDRVHFLGLREDVDVVLDALDVAAMSSDYEGLPSFLLEAMSRGRPIVCTDVGGVRDVLEPGRSVVLVPRRDPVALAGALHDLLRDPERRASMADAAREGLREVALDRVADRIGELYESLLMRPGRRGGRLRPGWRAGSAPRA